MDFKTLLILACVAAGTLAGPVRETLCAEECNSRDDEGMFRTSKSYHFAYNVDIDSRINEPNSNGQSSTVHIQATAVIEGLSACEKILKFRDISIQERRQDGEMVAAETADTFSTELSANPLRFSMEANGTITSVCPSAGEETWVLNVKRGFLSHIQAQIVPSDVAFAQAGIFETTVTGTCMPVYSSTGENTFTKTNDYLMCKDRTNLNMFVDAIPVHLLAPTRSPLASTLNCEYTMDSQGISYVECEEIHTLKPFTEAESRPETVVRTSIEKIRVTREIMSSLGSQFTRRTSPLYEDPGRLSDSNSEDVLSTISDICNSLTDGISSTTPGLFETLTKQLGDLDNNNMNYVVNRVFRTCQEGMSFLKDALIDCDTEQCAQGFHTIMMTENSAENDFYMKKWFMKLVFHKNPTKPIIQLVQRYVGPDMNLPAYYALSSMLHQYCRMSVDDCSRDPEIEQYAAVFENNLGSSCSPVDEEDKKLMLISLRALSNVGVIQSKSLLNRCSKDQNPMQIRVAAIQAYQWASCDDVPINRFLSTFNDSDIDSELRIAAYRAIIRCPSEELLQSIAEIMAIEKTNQVTCYVSSHVANVRNSQDMMQAELRMAIRESPLANVTKCGMDFRKFSHNYGISYYDDESGNGIHLDSDVIFSSKSYLPRSARINMNVDLFGYGLNLFELDARAEGWQEALETLITPSNEDRQTNMIEKVKYMMKKRVYRQKREGIKNTALNKIKKEYDSSHNLAPEASEEISLGLRILGNDVFYKDQDDFQQFVEMFSRESLMRFVMQLGQERSHEYSLNKNLKTSKVTIPTASGMPLEVNIQGALNAVMKASGRINVMGMMIKPATVAIEGTFAPSAAIKVHSNMMVDAHCACSGLSHVTTLSTSLNLGGSLSFENGMLRAKVNAPPTRQTIIHASSSLYYMQMNELITRAESEDTATIVDETLANPSYSLHISGSRPNVPFTLPEALFHSWGMEITLDKLDDSLVSYDLEAGYRVDNDAHHVHFLIGTPGSENFGVYSMDAAYHHSNMTLIIRTDSPQIGGTFFIGSLRNETNSKRIHLQETVMGNTYTLEAGVDTLPITNGVKYVPVFVFNAPEIANYNLQGHVSLTDVEKSWDLRLSDNAEEIVGLTGSVHNETNSKRLSLQETVSGATLEAGLDTVAIDNGVKYVPVFAFNAPNIMSYALNGYVSVTDAEKAWDLRLDNNGEEIVGLVGSLVDDLNSKRLTVRETVSGAVFEGGLDTVPIENGVKYVPVFVLNAPNLASYNLQGYVSCTDDEKSWELRLINDAEEKLISVTGGFVNNDAQKRLHSSGNVGANTGSFDVGFNNEITGHSQSITPIFAVSTSFPAVSVSLGGRPVILSDAGITVEELYLLGRNTRVIELTNLYLQGNRFGFQSRFMETIPFGIAFDMTNDEQRKYSVDLTVTSTLGDYNVRGLLFNRSADHIYRLEVITSVNNTEYFNVSSEFKNEINSLQYLDTRVNFRGQQILRTKNGLQVQELNAKNRFTPIFILETNRMGSYSVRGSADVSENAISLNDMALSCSKDIITVDGSASVDLITRSVSWRFNIGGAYVSEIFSGSASLNENMVTFQTSMTTNEEGTPDYRLAIDFRNSTEQGEILSWDGKIELEIPHHPEISFRMDTEYTLVPGRSSGNIFRLCYDGVDCTTTDKRITFGHDLTFLHEEGIIFQHDFEVTFTHPAAGQDVTVEWITSSISQVSSGTEFTVKDHEDVLFTTNMRYAPETPSQNGSIIFVFHAPGYFDYETRDIYHYQNPNDILYLSSYRSGEYVMSFLVRFNLTGEGENFWSSTFLKYTDIRNDEYSLEYILAQSFGGANRLNKMTIKRNADIKIFMQEQTVTDMTDERIESRYTRVAKTTFEPAQDLSYNQTVTYNRENGNTNIDMKLRFMPGQKPITLITDFTNTSMAGNQAGKIISTLSLPKTSITVLTEGKLENGVPSGNFSIKLQPLMGASKTYAIELAMKNTSTSLDDLSYDTALYFKSPSEVTHGLKHTFESTKEPCYVTSSLTGVSGAEEVTVSTVFRFNPNQKYRSELDLSLSIPEHEYAVSMRFDQDSRNLTIIKDSAPIWSSNFSQEVQESGAGFTYNMVMRESVMSYGSEMILTFSNVSDTYALNVQLQQNNMVVLYTDVTLDLYPGQKRFDLDTEVRSDYLPGYNTRTNLNFQKTELLVTFNTGLNVDNTDVVSMAFEHSTPAESRSRFTQLVIQNPTNPDPLLRHVVLADSCGMSGQRFTHNTTVMWGMHLPTQTIALRFIGNRNDTGANATMVISNEGRVFGFGRTYTFVYDKTNGTDQRGLVSFVGEFGPIFSLQTAMNNRSRENTKDYDTSVAMQILNQYPITIASSLVHNSGSRILDADITITYSPEKQQKLSAGIEVTRDPNGHSITMDLHHLINTIDITIFGAYSNSSDEFTMTLENSVLLAGENHQPQISFSLNRPAKEVSFSYIGDRSYGFTGRFVNDTTEAGRVYQFVCANDYNRRVVNYEMTFNEPQRLVGMTVNYNPENAQDTWTFEAGYINDTAVFASLDTVHSGQNIHNGSIVLSLDNSMPRILTSHIKWEPSWPQDFKDAFLNIVAKMEARRAERSAAMLIGFNQLKQTINNTAQRFLFSNAIVITQLIMLKTQVEMQWALNKPMVDRQVESLQMKLRAFNQTLHSNFLAVGSQERDLAYERFSAEFNDLSEYFSSHFPDFAMDVVSNWMSLAKAFEAIKDQFDEEAIIAYLEATEAAKNAFWENLFAQFDEDSYYTDPNFDPFWERLTEINEILCSVGPRVAEEFNSRIAVLKSEKRALKKMRAAIIGDMQIFNATLREALAGWVLAAESELEPFRNPDFTAYKTLVHDINETLRELGTELETGFTNLGEELKGMLLGLAIRFRIYGLQLSQTFEERKALFVTYAEVLQMRMDTLLSQNEFLRRSRRQADFSTASAGNLDQEALKKALALFQNKYSTSNVEYAMPHPGLPAVPQLPFSESFPMEDVVNVASDSYEERIPFNLTAVIKVLKKVFNGTYELTKLDLVNGEIVLKIFVKDFSNITSLTNKTRQYLNMMPLNMIDKINVSKIENVIGMLQDGSLGEFKARFMEQFTPNGTHFEQIKQEVEAETTDLRNTVADRMVPYLERIGDRIVEGGRPFFGRIMDLPEREERHSFLEDLIREMDVSGLERMMGRAKQTMCGVYNTMSAAAVKTLMAACHLSGGKPGHSSWLPPYDANALVIGAKHYMTFDKQFYDFSGKCGYLLAKDFVHENDFSAIIDYERDMEVPVRNMMFIINSTTFEIKLDGTVRVNRQARELPLVFGDTSIIRIGDAILLNNAHGITVVCKLPHDVCILQLTGRYFDRTAGLLGNFNFEPYDDLKTPGNVLQNNITSFTESWKVGKNCIQSQTTDLNLNRVIPSMDAFVNFDPLHPDNQACASLFLDNCSPLARCHGAVDPDSFYRMCILDTRALPEEQHQTKRCSIAAAYKSQCWQAKQPVPMPDECITCDAGEDSFSASKSIRIEGEAVPRQVDIVFIVEEKECTRQNVSSLNSLANRLSGELQDADYEDTRFGLVAFGGNDVHDLPHSHTINHKIFTDKSRELTLGIDSLEFAPNNEGSNGTFAAIKFAANYPFRTGATKHIILLSCAEFSDQESEIEFKDLSVMLRKRSISLTNLINFQFTIEKQSKSASKTKSKSKEVVYGIDTTATYTSKMAGQEIFKGSTTLRHYTNEPDTIQSLLAQESGGAIFDSSKLSDKGFNDVFVKRIVMKSEPVECQVCSCVPDGLVGVGRSVCEKCANPLNVFGEEIRAGVRDFELKHRLPHWRYPDQIVEEEEEE